MYIYQRYNIKAQREHFMKLKLIRNKLKTNIIYTLYTLYYIISIYYIMHAHAAGREWGKERKREREHREEKRLKVCKTSLLSLYLTRSLPPSAI